MSQNENIFQIDPIFFVPIDCEENSKHIEEGKNTLQKKQKYSESNSEKDVNSKIKHSKEKKKEKDVIVFSKSQNDRKIKSMANSSKIYITEIFKQNWKLKARRLITKLKKKLIKQYFNVCDEDENFEDKSINKTLSWNNYENSNYINNDELFSCENNTIFINNNNNCIRLGNSNNIDNCYINLPNAPTNININFNQFNNNCQVINNSLYSINPQTKIDILFLVTSAVNDFRNCGVHGGTLLGYSRYIILKKFGTKYSS